MSNNISTRTIPSAAMRCSVGQFIMGDNGEGAKSAPVTLHALSGGIIAHWFFGNIVHDLQGMEHKDRIAIDYCHDAKEIIGYVNKFSADGELVLSGALVPFKDSDRASEIVHKAAAGVPYQASIDYTPTKPEEILFEELREDQTATVNGQSVQGPLTIVRKWKLGGVAVCPYGADSDTATYLQSNNNKDTVEVKIMSNETLEAEAVATEQDAQAVEATNEQDETQQAVEAVEEKTVEAEAGEDEQTKPCEECRLTHADFAQYTKLYGFENGAKYFEQGLDAEQARAEYVLSIEADLESVKKENDDLRAQIAKLSGSRLSVPGHNPDLSGSDWPYILSKEKAEAIAKKHGRTLEDVTKTLKKKGV